MKIVVSISTSLTVSRLRNPTRAVVSLLIVPQVLAAAAFGLFAVAFPFAANAQNADLYIIDIHARDARRSGMVDAVARRPAWVYVELENLGAGPTPAGVKVQCRIFRRGEPPIVQGSRKMNQPLPAYGQRLVRVDLTGTGGVGTRQLRCTVDPDGQVLESNEANNSRQKRIELRRFRANAYRFEMRNFQPFTLINWDRYGPWSELGFQVYNPGRTIPQRQFLNNKPRWQVDCMLSGYPTRGVFRYDSAHKNNEYPTGDLPETGAGKSAMGKVALYASSPFGREMPRELDLDCTLRVGAFREGPTQQRHIWNGNLVPTLAWHPARVWWEATTRYRVINPNSEVGQSTAPPALDIYMSSVSASASPDNNETPTRSRNTWIRFTSQANMGAAPVSVECSVSQDNTIIRNNGTSTSIAPQGPGSSVYDTKGAINLGQLAAGVYTASCVADPAVKFKKDTARDNNLMMRNFTVQ